jgi:hypothetical protein
MNLPLRALAGLTLLVPFAFGCAGRTAPFDDMDKAQITVLRLQGQEPPPAAPVAQPGAAPLIPGIPPELQAAGQQILNQVGSALPPGLLPPGLIPGVGQPAAAPAPPPPPRFKGFILLTQMPLTDETVKEELLDVFGSEDSFNAQRGNCFFPGMGVSMVRPNGQPPVELLISLSCNQAMGDGFRWPYPANGFTPESSQKLTKIYEKLWGPVPPGGA